MFCPFANHLKKLYSKGFYTKKERYQPLHKLCVEILITEIVHKFLAGFQFSTPSRSSQVPPLLARKHIVLLLLASGGALYLTPPFVPIDFQPRDGQGGFRRNMCTGVWGPGLCCPKWWKLAREEKCNFPCYHGRRIGFGTTDPSMWLGDDLPKKRMFTCGHCPNQGGGRSLPELSCPFSQSNRP